MNFMDKCLSYELALAHIRQQLGTADTGHYDEQSDPQKGTDKMHIRRGKSDISE